MTEKTKYVSTISVYLDNGVVYEYDVTNTESQVMCGAKAREHVSAIVATGYRSTDNKSQVMTHFPPHRISKVTASGVTTSYPDRVRGT